MGHYRCVPLQYQVSTAFEHTGLFAHIVLAAGRNLRTELQGDCKPQEFRESIGRRLILAGYRSDTVLLPIGME